MKKFLAMLLSTAVLYSCGGSDQKTNETEEAKPADTAAATAPAPAPATPAPATPSAGADDEKALTLIGSSDCTTCHAIDKKLIGPAYIDVSKKYEDTKAVEDTLISKVKHGGMGNWGNIPMTPHPDLPDDDIRVMIKYILSLKNKQ